MKEEKLDLDKIANGTYICAMYLPESDGPSLNVPQFAIKHPKIKGIDLMR